MKKIISALLITAMICSMAVISASAAVLRYDSMDSMEDTAEWILLGSWYNEDGCLKGDDPAKCFQGVEPDEDNYADTGWITYGYGTGVFPQAVDIKYTLSAEWDDFTDGTNRNFAMTYCTDVPVALGTGNRLFLSFAYDWNQGKFYLVNGFGSYTAETALCDPVEKEIVADGEFFAMGMSVTENRVRCYYNNELIFDYTDEEGVLGLVDAENSDLGVLPFCWNNQNLISIDNITYADACDIYPLDGEVSGGVVTDAPTTDAPTTDAPETEAPETDAPETDAPETEAPNTTEVPETTEAESDGLPTGAIIGIVAAVLVVVAVVVVVIVKKKK